DFPNVDDGVNDPSLGKNGRTATGFADRSSSISAGVSGTASQKAVINSLTAPVLGIPTDQMTDLSALLYAPAMAGTQVSIQ
ncbi:MAG: virulence factor Mce, partial [Marmoricola sp.]